MQIRRPSRVRCAGHAARRFAALITAAAAAAAASAGCTSGTGTTAPPTPVTTASAPQASGSPCPSSAAAGPSHTLTFPQSVGDYQITDGPTSIMQHVGETNCTLPAQVADYSDSQGDFVTMEAGHHGTQWRTFSDFWGAYYALSGLTPTMIDAGTLGGQAGCGTDNEGSVCHWFDSDTFGDFLGSGTSMSQSQTASLMLTFRSAIEHSG